MDEWIHEGLPPIGSRALVWLNDGSVRHVARCGFYGDLRFTDCTHPAQNVCCGSERVKAWRLEEPQEPMPTFPAQIDPSNWLGGLLGF